MTIDFTTWRNSYRNSYRLKAWCYTGNSDAIGIQTLYKLFFNLRDRITHMELYPCKFHANSQAQITLHAAANFSGSKNCLPHKQKEARERPWKFAYKYQERWKKEWKLQCGTSARLPFRNIFETLSLIVTRITLLSVIKLLLICDRSLTESSFQSLRKWNRST